MPREDRDIGGECGLAEVPITTPPVVKLAALQM